MDVIFASSLLIAAATAGIALGAGGATVMFVAPTAFKKLDYSRADSLVRRLLQAGLPWIAGFAAGGAAFAIVGTSIGAAIMLFLAASGMMIARFALNPLPSKKRVPGVRRRYKQQRIVALWTTTALLLLFPAAVAAMVIGI